MGRAENGVAALENSLLVSYETIMTEHLTQDLATVFLVFTQMSPKATSTQKPARRCLEQLCLESPKLGGNRSVLL